MTSKMDEVFRKVLNDRDIFDSKYDKNVKKPIPKLFEEEDWKELWRLFTEIQKLCHRFSIAMEDIKKLRKESKLPEELDKKISEFEAKIENRIREIEVKEQKARGWRRNKINELKQQAEWLRSALNTKPHLLKKLFENLGWYGIVECKLPNMENYGKVIERYDISIVEQYFADKIKRASYSQSRALEKILGYIKELYDAGTSPEEIAYFVRKIDSLTKYWEVIE